MAGMIKGAVDPMFQYPTGGGGNSGRPLTSLYNGAATQQSEDYDKIMAGYDDLLSSARNRRSNYQPLSYTPINPVFQSYTPNYSYSRTGDMDRTISGLSEYAKTGGYSDSDINNIRERGISPIRSIYSSAQENVKRQKNLSGGYSPNIGAVQAKLARQLSSQIGDITTKVNADIAQMVANGKLAGYQALSPLVSQDNQLANNASMKNEDARVDQERFNSSAANEAARLNAQIQAQFDEINNRNISQTYDDEARALAGKTSLYGTTPALTSLFGSQALSDNAQQLQAVTTANQLKNARANMGIQILDSPFGPVAGARR